MVAATQAMPRRQDLNTILILGSGPIVIGQACEFDYSGTQACKALREEGFRVVLVNSNPATIMTDPAFSDRTYLEPVTPEAVRKILAREAEGDAPIDALLPTIGGQTALNVACMLYDDGTLERYGVELIGAGREVIDRAENRQAFRRIVESIGLRQPGAGTASSLREATAFLDEVGLPVVIRPAFTLGGTGGGIAYNHEEFEEIVRGGLEASMIGQVLIDEALLGWKEFELEVVRDANDNCVIVCGIENVDPMGVHTGDSITVAPIMTLPDREYQQMRDAAIAIMRAVGVDTGGSNVQFAVNPDDGAMVVIEMNPRVSRSSALASKATGFPIARVAARLAVGYTLDELGNDITGTTSACFEPSIDYVVTKMPRWTFEKFPEADETLTTSMKSVGEAMSIGRTFTESLQKVIRSMEVKRFGLGLDRNDWWLAAKRAADGQAHAADGSRITWPIPEETMVRKLSVPSQGRLYYIRYAYRMGWALERVAELTRIDPWFLDQIQQLVEFEDELCSYERLQDVPERTLFRAKQMGYSDPQLANLYLGDISTKTILAVRRHRKGLGIEPVYKLVDTCAGEFEAITPYYYSTYETPFERDGAVLDDEIRVTERRKIVIACRDADFESVMINSNPETVSTDYDTSDFLFFEPLTLEDTLNVVERLNGGAVGAPGRRGGVIGCIVQYGGQTPLNLAHGLVAAGVPLIGTGLDSIDLAEDRDRFQSVLVELGMNQPANGIARSLDEAVAIARQVGYPVLVRPSYVLGGRGMETCFDERSLRRYMQTAVDVSDLAHAPILIDKFLSEAIEVDVDVVADAETALICGVMEHIEEAGVHSGDSTCTIPPYSLPRSIVSGLKEHARRLARRLEVRGLMNAQMAVRDETIYILEVNPRASRTVPFVSKAKGRPWARIAARVMMGASLDELEVREIPDAGFFSVKEPVFPFDRFPGVDVILGPEMRSTGEVMGMDKSLPVALAKAQMAAGVRLPTEGSVFLSVRDTDKPQCVEIARSLVSMGFRVYTTQNTRDLLRSYSVDTLLLRKISEGARPNIVDKLASGEIDLIINTPTRKGAHTDEGRIRAMAVGRRVPMITTVTGAKAAVQAIAALRAGAWSVAAVQDYALATPLLHSASHA
jgi:carbamoyl-phosphate synthase large subunit